LLLVLLLQLGVSHWVVVQQSQGLGARLMASRGFPVLNLGGDEWVATLEWPKIFFSRQPWSSFAFPSSFGVV
jgi:hypothetical protein